MPPVPDALWRTASPELQAAILLLVQHFEHEIWTSPPMAGAGL
jgi:hypothetical protein